MKQLYTLFVSFLFTLPVFAQPAKSDGKGYVNDLLNVRFQTSSDLELKEGVLYVGGTTSAIPSEIRNAGYWTPLYSSATSELDKLWENAQKNLNKQLPDPKAVYLFHLYNTADRDKVAGLLKALPFVKSTSIVPIPFNASAPDYQGSELFLENGDEGINAVQVWGTHNNRGAGIKVCDIEYDFNAQHTDLPNVTIVADLVPEDPFNGGGFNHGTAVLGEIASLNNATGTTGIASDCQLFFSGPYHDGIYNFEDAMLLAVLELSPGDVILIEQQIDGPNFSGNDQNGLVPMEWYESYYNAIQLAVGNEVIVVEAAGNGAEDLDAEIYSMDNGGHYPFLPGNGSGAIMVGAGAVGNQELKRAKLWFSNYGSCVHVQGNGESITTTGYGDLYSAEGVNTEFTAGFGGTSGASPIVTGAIVLLQAVYEEATGSRLNRDEVLNLLLATGKPQVEGTIYPLSNHIGPLPDIHSALTFLLDHLGTAELASAEVSVYPNPGNGSFILRSEKALNASGITIRDVTGKTVAFQAQLKGQNLLAIDLDAEANGIYFLQHEGAEESFTVKIAVNR